MRIRRLLAFGLIVSCLLTGCVDQSQGTSSTSSSSQDTKIIATSVSVTEICDKLDLDLIGVPQSSVSTLPERYKDVATIGTAMSPDMEIVSSIDPDWIISPVSLMSDLQPKYAEIQSDYAFVNLNSVWGMYKSIQELGEIFDRQEQAEELVDEFITYYNEYQSKNEEKKSPKVLVLMGFPGSYVVATEQSYVGSLVKMAGGENVFGKEEGDFVNINTEELAKSEPDIILRASHAMPEQVSEMFADEFKTNDIWKHFDAVSNGKVYDLPSGQFGMSANFQYQDALESLQTILYGEDA